MSKARIIADYAGTGASTDLATQTELDASETAMGFQSVPHIVPGVLYPSYVASGTSNKLLDGVTAHSGAFGTAQSDGRKYYYTNIAGSKPIKDPRIGAHFGSQRYKFTSLQALEQETATHGDEIFSIDGREWAKSTATMLNDAQGVRIAFTSGTSDTIEVVGYFMDANLLSSVNDGTRTVKIELDGVTKQATLAVGATVNSPLFGRYVDTGSVINAGLGTVTLGIHTIKITRVTANSYFSGIELIAQDTSNVNNIQIPSQNVVSYGKKFTVSGTPHYNPFAFKTDGSTAWTSGAHNGTSWPVGTGSSANIDTATSLGLANWLHSSNYYKPYNGGRVVVWVASDGTIKTSVTVMPPNARSVGNSASLTNATAKANASIANNTFYPTMEAGTIDHSLSEVAKTFHWREFGNGAANGGTGHASYADASMLNGSDDIAYVMDDGLTSLSADDVEVSGSPPKMGVGGSGDYWYSPFIGTGVSTDHSSNGNRQIAMNLPYGTHILKNGFDGATDTWVDGINVISSGDAFWELEEITIYQPKKPPIPEDAVVLADYMLMADFVVKTGAADGGAGKISKGVRWLNSSRDIFYDGAGLSLSGFSSDVGFLGGYQYGNDTSALVSKIPSFSTQATKGTYDPTNRRQAFKVNGSTVSTTVSTGGHGGYYHPTAVTTLGNNIWSTEGSQIGTTPAGTTQTQGFEFAIPIHTSSHYQTFETPFLHELVGGDRNMEQTNLVVTPDGKTWDELRDTSYIGKSSLAARISADFTSEQTIVFDDFRGLVELQPLYNKDFAIGYDRFICLKDGAYNVSLMFHASANATSCYLRLYINGTRATNSNIEGAGSLRGNLSQSINYNFKRGDYLQISATNRIEGTDQQFHTFQITRL